MQRVRIANRIIRRRVASRGTIGLAVVVGLLIVGVGCRGAPGKPSGQARPEPLTEFVPYDQFLEQTRKAELADYAARSNSKVRSAAEFSRMKEHILSRYEGVVVRNSFVLDNAHVDCIAINTQPGLKRDGKLLTVQTPPPAIVIKEVEEPPGGQPVQEMLAAR